jgi:hypothetical protein
MVATWAVAEVFQALGEIGGLRDGFKVETTNQGICLAQLHVILLLVTLGATASVPQCDDDCDRAYRDK